MSITVTCQACGQTLDEQVLERVVRFETYEDARAYLATEEGVMWDGDELLVCGGDCGVEPAAQDGGERLCGCDGDWPCREQANLQAERDEARAELDALRRSLHAVPTRTLVLDDGSQIQAVHPADLLDAIGEQP